MLRAAWYRLGAILAGISVLWLLDLLMQPVPVAAGPAFLLAIALLLWKGGQNARIAFLVAGVGAVAGVFVHTTWHWTGQSPKPAGGLWAHLAWEGLLGYAAAVLALLPSVAILRKIPRH